MGSNHRNVAAFRDRRVRPADAAPAEVEHLPFTDGLFCSFPILAALADLYAVVIVVKVAARPLIAAGRTDICIRKVLTRCRVEKFVYVLAVGFGEKEHIRASNV